MPAADKAAGGSQKNAIEASQSGSFNHLFRAYQTSPAFKKLKPKTQEGYISSMRALSDILGRDPALHLTRPKAQAFYEKLQEKKSIWVANSHMTVLGTILGFGVGKGLIRHNVMLKFKMERIKPFARYWEDAELLAMITAADKLQLHSIADLIIAGVNTGQRQADIFKFTREITWAERYHITQNKKGKVVILPRAILESIRPRMIDAARRADSLIGRQSEHIFVSERSKRPFTEHSHFGRLFREVRIKAANAVPSILEGSKLCPGKPIQFKGLRDNRLYKADHGRLQ